MTDETSAPPTSMVTGFTQQAFALKIVLGYMTLPDESLMLFAYEQWTGKEPVMWRKFLVPQHSALKSAESLCDDASRYLDMVSTKWRPSEDLDFDDFMEHLRLHVEGGMH